jgi:Na+/proline symporter
LGAKVGIALDYLGTIIIIGYFVGLIAIGAWTSKKIKNSEDFWWRGEI